MVHDSSGWTLLHYHRGLDVEWAGDILCVVLCVPTQPYRDGSYPWGTYKSRRYAVEMVDYH